MEKEHNQFKRIGNDLYMEHTIGITEALCGFQFSLTHLDDRKILIKYPPGKIIQPGKFSLCVRSDNYPIQIGFPNFFFFFFSPIFFLPLNFQILPQLFLNFLILKRGNVVRCHFFLPERSFFFWGGGVGVENFFVVFICCAHYHP